MKKSVKDYGFSSLIRVFQQSRVNFTGVSEAAKRNQLSKKFLYWLLSKGKIVGAQKVPPNIWQIPKDWQYKKPKKGKRGRKLGSKFPFALKDPSLLCGMPSKTQPNNKGNLCQLGSKDWDNGTL